MHSSNQTLDSNYANTDLVYINWLINKKGEQKRLLEKKIKPIFFMITLKNNLKNL